MPTMYRNPIASTGPAPQTLRDALAAILNGDHTMSMAGGSPGQTLASALGQPSGGMVMKPTHSTAEEGAQPRMIGGEAGAPVAIDTPAAAPMPMPTRSPVPLDLSNASVKHPGFFAPGGVGRSIIGTLSDAALAATGNAPVYWPRKMQMAQMQREDARLKLAQDREDRVANRPIFNSLPNIGLVAIDPNSGTSNVIQPARSAAKAYVEDDLGLKPTDPEYQVALADYLLKGSGPTAFGYRSALQDDRQESQAALQEDRQAAAVEAMRTRLGLNEKLASYRESLYRGRPAKPGRTPAPTTNSVVAPILAKLAAGGTLTPGEQAALNYNRSGRGRGITTAGGYTVQPGGGAPRVPGTKENPAVLTKPDDYKFLQKGTYFRDPDGHVRQKQ